MAALVVVGSCILSPPSWFTVTLDENRHTRLKNYDDTVDNTKVIWMMWEGGCENPWKALTLCTKKETSDAPHSLDDSATIISDV